MLKIRRKTGKAIEAGLQNAIQQTLCTVICHELLSGKQTNSTLQFSQPSSNEQKIGLNTGHALNKMIDANNNRA